MAHIEMAEEFATFRDAVWFQSLLNHNVRHVEQLMGLLNNGLGQIALKEMGADIGDVSTQVDTYLQNHFGTNLQAVFAGHHTAPVELNYFHKQTDRRPTPRVFGYHLNPKLESLGFMDKVVLPDSIETADAAKHSPRTQGGQAGPMPAEYILEELNQLPPPRDQAYRGTCVAFTCVSMLEFMLRAEGHDAQLSPQYLYYRAKLQDGNQQTDGTQFTYAMDALRDYGTCLEHAWPYQDFPDWAYSSMFRKAYRTLKSLDELAQQCRISASSSITPATDVIKIKRQLLRGKPVGVGLQTFRSVWIDADYAEHKGEIQMPMTKVDSSGTYLLDEALGGHAVTLIGYKDNEAQAGRISHRPGGGYFIFKNSWGQNWARANTEAAPGYGQLPYAYIEQYCVAAWVIDRVIWNGAAAS